MLALVVTESLWRRSTDSKRESAAPVMGPTDRALRQTLTTTLIPSSALASRAKLTPSWFMDARDAPDSVVRLSVLELWAQSPRESLDPVTYALVDPDESVRARAQDLLEETLARR